MLARYSSAVVKDASVHHQRWLSDEPPQTVWHLHDVIQFLRHSETANHTITVSTQQFVGCVEVRKEPGLEHRLSKRSLFFPYATISVTCVDLRVRHYECLAGEDCLQTCAIILLHNGVWSLSLKASFSTSLSTASRRCWRGYTLSFIDFKTTWVKGLNQLTEMDEDRKRQVDSLPCNATVVNNYNAEVPVRGHAVVPELQHLYAASRSPNTHLAENRLSTDFCDWSEVTDGLLWETWREKGRVRRGKEGEKKRSSGIFLWLFRSALNMRLT